MSVLLYPLPTVLEIAATHTLFIFLTVVFALPSLLRFQLRATPTSLSVKNLPTNNNLFSNGYRQ